jgi:hypothetical protein
MSSEAPSRPGDASAAGPAGVATAATTAGDDVEHDRLELTDPKAMRALAHPLRMALIELLGVNETLTATQASELLGESPANCAFHLRTLAKYGFAEEAGGGRGRERPWRRTHARITLPAKQDDPEASVLAESLGRAWRERWFERARQVLSESQAMPQEWRTATQSTRSLFYLTPGEMSELGEQVLALFRPYYERREAASRPKDAMPAELLFLAYPVAGVEVLDDPDGSLRTLDEPEEQN